MCACAGPGRTECFLIWQKMLRLSAHAWLGGVHTLDTSANVCVCVCPERFSSLLNSRSFLRQRAIPQTRCSQGKGGGAIRSFWSNFSGETLRAKVGLSCPLMDSCDSADVELSTPQLGWNKKQLVLLSECSWMSRVSYSCSSFNSIKLYYSISALSKPLLG